MSTDRYTEWLDDFVDGSLSEHAQAELKAHLSQCEICREAVEDLRRIKDGARSLKRQTPPERVWRQIAESGRDQHVGSTWKRYRPMVSARSWAVAASVLLALGVGALLFWCRSSSPPAGEDPAALANYIVAELQQAQQHYQNAIAGLEKIVQDDQEILDPELQTVLEENLSVIERAIAESRLAIQAQPASQVAQDSLLDALRDKLSLLQNTVLLINEIRKGRGEGAVDLLNKMRDPPPPSTRG
ncbi:MAG: anti-sigma factor family protein [Acidobacteriota bacterium]